MSIEQDKMLYVERRVDIDARCQEFLDVTPTFGMATSHRIGVGQFID